MEQRLERADYHVDSARRQYGAVEPENRLVARTLERDWEEALSEKTRLQAEYERFRREHLRAPGPKELAAIRGLSEDLPALWNTPTTTQEDRQAIVRLVLERVLVDVVGETEQVRVECHWHGGNRTSHQLIRPIMRTESLSTYPDLIARATDLHEAGHDFGKIAEILNNEGWRPPKRSTTFNEQTVRRFLIKSGAVTPKYKRREPQIDRHPDEWTIHELAELIDRPETTIYGWAKRGLLSTRRATAGTIEMLLVRADAATIATFKKVPKTRAPWRYQPPLSLPPRENATKES